MWSNKSCPSSNKYHIAKIREYRLVVRYYSLDLKNCLFLKIVVLTAFHLPFQVSMADQKQIQTCLPVVLGCGVRRKPRCQRDNTHTQSPIAAIITNARLLQQADPRASRNRKIVVVYQQSVSVVLGYAAASLPTSWLDKLSFGQYGYPHMKSQQALLISTTRLLI